jgi:hypothetical protein
LGDTTEGALLPLSVKCGMNVAEQLSICPRLDVIPFERLFII